jgi:hypothetical protein
MKGRSLRFKIMGVGILAVLVPLFVVGGFSILTSRTALEAQSKSETTEIAKGLANLINMVVLSEIKIAEQTAQREVLIELLSKHAQGTIDETLVSRATAELTSVTKRSGAAYESIFAYGMDGKVIADGEGGEGQTHRFIQAGLRPGRFVGKGRVWRGGEIQKQW